MKKKRNVKQISGVPAQQHLRDVLFEDESQNCNMLSRIVGFELDNGRKVFIKETCEKISDEVDGKVVYEQDYDTVYRFHNNN